MDVLGNILVLAAEKKDEGGSFLVSPGLGLMIWTLIAFGISMFILRRFAFPLIQDALEKRANMIAEEIDRSQKMREEADKLLQEYRERLKEAREQAEDILVRSRKAAEQYEAESKEQSRKEHAEAMERTRREIEAETRRALDEADQKRLIEEALSEVDFSVFASEGNGSTN